MAKKQRWWNSGWTISIATALLPMVLGGINDYTKSQPIFSTLVGWLICLWHLIISFFRFKLELWWVLTALLVFIIIAQLIAQRQSVGHDFRTYRKDVLKRWTWTWEWERNPFGGKWQVSNLRPLCPDCGTTLLEHDYFGYNQPKYKCPRCTFSALSSQCEEKFDIEALIIDNIDRGTYKTKPE